MKKTIFVQTIFLLTFSIHSGAQSTNGESKTKSLEVLQNTRMPNDFPELVHTDIPGAPRLGKPQLIMGDSLPVIGGGMGWAAPAVYDWNNDGKKDLLIGEFASGFEHGKTVGHFMRFYQNKGTDQYPKFSDLFSYAYGDILESTGTPLSVYTWCCIAFTPRFADLDNDGFMDLLTGQYYPGYVSWFRGSDEGFKPGVRLEEHYDPLHYRQYSSSDDFYTLPVTDPKGRRYWNYSSAAFGDFDGDGDQDMVIGGMALRFCENIGTKSTPKFGKREPLLDVNGNLLQSDPVDNMVPYVVDWDGDGTLDIMMTDAHQRSGDIAVTYFRGLKGTKRSTGGKIGLQFEEGIPLFEAKNGGKAFPGSWLNVWVTDWNDDGINDLLIGTSVAVMNGEFDHKLSWSWEKDTKISKKNPAYYSAAKKRIIAKQPSIREEYYGKDDAYKDLVHQGYVYVMLGEK